MSQIIQAIKRGKRVHYCDCIKHKHTVSAVLIWHYLKEYIGSYSIYESLLFCAWCVWWQKTEGKWCCNRIYNKTGQNKWLTVNDGSEKQQKYKVTSAKWFSLRENCCGLLQEKQVIDFSELIGGDRYCHYGFLPFEKCNYICSLVAQESWLTISYI